MLLKFTKVKWNLYNFRHIVKMSDLNGTRVEQRIQMFRLSIMCSERWLREDAALSDRYINLHEFELKIFILLS